MGFINELKQAIEKYEGFEQFIDDKMQENPDFLQLTFGSNQTTILNYLILEHDIEDEETDLTKHINYIIKLGANSYSGQPIHLALEHSKLDLVPLLLGTISNSDDELDPKNLSRRLELNARDIEGKTMIARALDAEDINTLKELLKLKPDINQPSRWEINSTTFRAVLPIHQAVLMNFPDAIEALIKEKAQLNNPCGKAKEPLLVLAARYGCMDSLETLLKHIKPTDITNPLDDENNYHQNAVDLLCRRLRDNQNPSEAIRGLAMLFCRGASAPRLEQDWELLTDHRKELLAAVKEYTRFQPSLSYHFVNAAHDKNNPMHNIIYGAKTWGQPFRHFFARPDKQAFKLEKLVSRAAEAAKQDGKMDDEGEENKFSEDNIRFAKFMQLYKADIKKRTFYNPWSSMLWKLTRGEVTSCGEIPAESTDSIKTAPPNKAQTTCNVVNYATTHRHSRSANIVFKTMRNTREECHVDLDQTSDKVSYK